MAARVGRAISRAQGRSGFLDPGAGGSQLLPSSGLFLPEPYEAYPSHLHIDLLPRAQGRGFGRRMLEQVMSRLRQRGSPGVHLGVSAFNTPAIGFYDRLASARLSAQAPGRCLHLHGQSLRD